MFKHLPIFRTNNVIFLIRFQTLRHPAKMQKSIPNLRLIGIIYIISDQNASKIILFKAVHTLLLRLVYVQCSVTYCTCLSICFFINCYSRSLIFFTISFFFFVRRKHRPGLLMVFFCIENRAITLLSSVQLSLFILELTRPWLRLNLFFAELYQGTN